MFSATDVIEHLIDPKDIFHFITSETQCVALFVSDDDAAGGRHPFHFPFNKSMLQPTFKELGFAEIAHDILCVWVKK
jgi:hypothetical protein